MLKSQTNVPGGQASGDTYADIANALETANDLINKKQIQKSIMIETFPGYLPDKYQKNIKDAAYTYVYAEQGWDTQKYLTFSFVPGMSRRYNPFTAILMFKGQIVKVADENTGLDTNALPVEGFYRKFFKKIEIKNLNTNTLVNKSVEYDTDLFDFMANWYYDTGDYVHEEASRNQGLVQSLGRRLGANASNNRIENRLNAGENQIWVDKRLFMIDMSKIHSFFSINELMWVPLEIKLYFNDDYRKLVEIKPTEAVDAANQYDTIYKMKFDTSFPPQIMLAEYTMTPMYLQEEDTLFSENGIYDYGNYAKVTKRSKTIPLGADQAVIDITGITERPEWLILQIQSLTSQEHLSHYDSYNEDVALNLIKRVVITDINNADGKKEIDFEINNSNKMIDKLMAYNSLKRFTNGAPVFSTNTSLKNTKYMKNFCTWSQFRKGIENKDQGNFPLVFDLSDSKGTYDGTADNNSFISPKIQCVVYLNATSTKQHNLVVTIVTTGKYALHMNDNGQPEITKV